jgi:mannose-6-phosphate isomerase-like protein (cupin superfamily)/L-amino acid N-acyltransferase YncA
VNFMRLADLDVAPLLARLAEHPDLWVSGLRAQYPGSAHAAADTIFLRWTEEMTIDAAFNELESIDTPAAHALMPELAALTGQLVRAAGEVESVGRCILARLAHGAAIPPHIDEGLYADYFDRFHVCLSGRSRFTCGGESIVVSPGQAFWFNRKRPHDVVAEASSERVHLILDLEAPAYLARRGVYVQHEPFADCWDEMKELFRGHYEEIAFYKDIELEPDEPAYVRLAEAGLLRVFTVRDAGALVGYVMFIVRWNPHYRSSLIAMQDVLYLKPEYRRGRTGITLIRVAETRLRAEGVQVVYHHVKRTNRVGELLERLGYELVDQLYAKRLDKKEGE